MANQSHFLADVFEKSNYFIPHGHCYLWIPSLLWMHVVSDLLIGMAYIGISLILYVLVKRIRLPFSPVFIAFGLFIALCGLTHFMSIWTVWNPDYWIDGWLKAATAAASVATAIGLVYVRPRIEEVTHAARLSEERRIRLESTHAELESLYQQVTELNEVRSQFFANVSHELRTPLALIIGPVEKMLRSDNVTPEQRKQLESMGRNGKQLLSRVNDLLDASKLEAGKMQVQYVRLDLAAWLKKIASQFEVVAEQRRIHFHVETPEFLIAEVDPEMIERIFINLLSNAFKFAPDNGKIQVNLKQRDQELAILVADNGPGVTADQRNMIFERFRQASGGTTRQYGGTGLGLAIARDFANLHGGDINVDEAPIGGAQFVMHCPMRAPAGREVKQAPSYLGTITQVALSATLQDLTTVSSASASDAVSPHVPGRPTVLVVEDNAEMRAFIAGVLAEDYNMVTAADGQEGLERAMALRPDLLVTDIMMPTMSGDQLVKTLRSNSAFDAVPILLLSAKADDELRVTLLHQGAQDYLNKPFLPQELHARAANLIVMKLAGDTLRELLSSTSEDLEGLASELGIKHRQLQAALEATEVARQQAESASRVKAEFLAMVSHELRTPLSTIAMNVELLQSANTGGSVSTLPIALERLNRATLQMSSLVEGLLQYTRLESGKLHLHIQDIDTVQLARMLVSTHIQRVQPNVELLVRVPQHDMSNLVSDLRLVQVVLDNLLSNALKFTQSGTVTLAVDHNGKEHIFSVHDTGIGIPEADIGRIFQPFEQLEPIRRKSIPGIGLGLSIVKQLVEALGGSIEVTSKLDAGSIFTVHLKNFKK